MNTDVFSSFAQTYEDTRQFLIGVTEQVSAKLDEAIEKALEKEMEIKHEFFLSKNNV